MLRGLGHEASHVAEHGLGAEDDEYLVRHLSDVDCNWLLTQDLHRQPEVWMPVYTHLSDGDGRLVRLHPRAPAGLSDDGLIAHLTRLLVAKWEKWSPDPANPRSRLIEVGQGLMRTKRGTVRTQAGINYYRVFDASEVSQVLQARFSMGDPSSSASQASVPSGPRQNRRVKTRKGSRPTE